MSNWGNGVTIYREQKDGGKNRFEGRQQEKTCKVSDAYLICIGDGWRGLDVGEEVEAGVVSADLLPEMALPHPITCSVLPSGSIFLQSTHTQLSGPLQVPAPPPTEVP